MLSAFSSGGEPGTTVYSDLDFDQFLNKSAIESGIPYGSANDEEEKPCEFRRQRDAETNPFLGDICSDEPNAAFRNPVSLSLTVSVKESESEKCVWDVFATSLIWMMWQACLVTPLPALNAFFIAKSIK